MTWLYAVGTNFPELVWGPCVGKVRIDQGYRSKDDRARKRKNGIAELLSKKERTETPPQFRDLLLSLVRP